MNKVILCLIFSLFFSIKVTAQCSKYQHDKALTIGRNFSNEFVTEHFDGGRNVKFVIDDCYHNSYSEKLELEVTISWNGDIKLQNFYKVKGNLEIDKENKCTFLTTYKNESAQKYISVNKWMKIIQIGKKIKDEVGELELNNSVNFPSDFSAKKIMATNSFELVERDGNPGYLKSKVVNGYFKSASIKADDRDITKAYFEVYVPNQDSKEDIGIFVFEFKSKNKLKNIIHDARFNPNIYRFFYGDKYLILTYVDRRRNLKYVNIFIENLKETLPSLKEVEFWKSESYKKNN